MKTPLSNLDFWDEPLPAAAVRRLLRPGCAGRRALPTPLAPTRPHLLRARPVRRLRAGPTGR